MLIYPAIDLYEGRAVRLYKGRYEEMTVYGDDPAAFGEDFARCGAERIHIVDLEGARFGGTPNLGAALEIKRRSGLFCELGGGLRSMEAIERCLGAGIDRVILGTAAVLDEPLVKEAAARYGERIAIGADVKDGEVAIKGWTEGAGVALLDFCRRMQDLGLRSLICTDISRDGAMRGTNLELYAQLSRELSMEITASGGVSTLEDVKRLAQLGLHGAIIGKAYYTGSIALAEAIGAAK